MYFKFGMFNLEEQFDYKSETKLSFFVTENFINTNIKGTYKDDEKVR
jgi:hypothetical protein